MLRISVQWDLCLASSQSIIHVFVGVWKGNLTFF